MINQQPLLYNTQTFSRTLTIPPFLNPHQNANSSFLSEKPSAMFFFFFQQKTQTIKKAVFFLLLNGRFSLFYLKNKNVIRFVIVTKFLNVFFYLLFKCFLMIARKCYQKFRWFSFRQLCKFHVSQNQFFFNLKLSNCTTIELCIY